MRTLGWLFILVGAYIVQATIRGQVIDPAGKFVLMKNLSDTVLAFLNNDAKALNAVNNAEVGSIIGEGVPSAAPVDPGITMQQDGTVMQPDSTPGFDRSMSRKTKKLANNWASNVQPHVEEIAGQFNIKTVGTYAGHGDKGAQWAADFMTNDKATHDAILAYARANAKRLNIKYVITMRRIWSVQRNSEGVRVYTRYNPHTDHVHIDFN